MDSMGPDERSLLLQVLLEAGSLEKRLSVMMQSSVAEKRLLAKDLAEFSKRIKKLEKIKSAKA